MSCYGFMTLKYQWGEFGSYYLDQFNIFLSINDIPFKIGLNMLNFAVEIKQIVLFDKKILDFNMR
ncbi:hypothetical protein C6H66_16225 [Photorhabdus hindustanensis]|uniref:Uncharacterized protein n=1 Tax=Photorhabdus hindustanensis TaxID=2918802 RepID=A0A2S8PYN3_9GAMM|nr:hypothetical protein C6H66_16225 [Photorhabdus hindustanensis]